MKVIIDLKLEHWLERRLEVRRPTNHKQISTKERKTLKDHATWCPYKIY